MDSILVNYLIEQCVFAAVNGILLVLAIGQFVASRRAFSVRKTARFHRLLLAVAILNLVRSTDLHGIHFFPAYLSRLLSLNVTALLYACGALIIHGTFEVPYSLMYSRPPKALTYSLLGLVISTVIVWNAFSVATMIFEPQWLLASTDLWYCITLVLIAVFSVVGALSLRTAVARFLRLSLRPAGLATSSSLSEGTTAAATAGRK